MKQSETLLKNYAGVAEGSSLKVSSSFARTAASVVASTAVVNRAFKSLSDNANLADLADIFDLTGEKASALFGVFSTSGGNLREAQESLATFNQRINDAISGRGKEAQELFRELNIGAQEFAELDVADRFYKLIDAVKSSQSPLGKLNLLMKAVGEDGGKNLSRILPLSSEEIRKIGETAKITNEQLQQSREAFRAFQEVGAAASNIWRKTVAAIAPTLKIIADFIKENVDAAYEWIDNNLRLSKSIKDVAKEFTDWFRQLTPQTKQAIAAILALSVTVGVLTVAVATFGIVLNTFFGGIGIWAGIIATAIAGVGLWVYHIGSLRKAWNQVQRAAEDFWRFIKPALPALGALLVAVTAYFAPITAGLILIAVYWDDVTQAAEEFYQFIKPTLRETWNLIKLVGFAIRDNLIMTWKELEKAALRAWDSLKVFLQQNNITVDWSKIKYGLRDFMIYAQYVFTNTAISGKYAWAAVRLNAIIALDEILKHMFIVHVAVVAGFVYAAKAVEKVFKNLLTSLVRGIDQAVQAIWTAIKTGKLSDIENEVKKIVESLVVNVGQPFAEIEDEIKKRIGDVKFHQIERDGIKIPVGIEVQGIKEARDKASKDLVDARIIMDQGFEEFKLKRLQRNQIEDAMAVIGEVFEDLILPGFFRIQQEAAVSGKQAGMNFANEFGKEAKKLDAVLFDSAEALSRIDEYREARQQERSQRPTSTFRRADDNLAIIRILEQIANNTLISARKEPIEVVPAGVP